MIFDSTTGGLITLKGFKLGHKINITKQGHTLQNISLFGSKNVKVHNSAKHLNNMRSILFLR